MGERSRGGFTARGAAALAALLCGGLACGPLDGDSEHEVYQKAYQLRFVVQPSDSKAGQAIQPAVEVEVVDLSGERVWGLETMVTLHLPSRTQAGNLQGFSGFTRDGRGVFPYLTVVHPGAYELEARSMGLVTARSVPFTVTSPLEGDAPGSGALGAEARPAR